MRSPPKLSPDEFRLITQIFAEQSKLRDAIENDPAVAKQREEIYQAIGEAITEWAAVEGWLAAIYAFCVTGVHRLARATMPANAAFHAVVNFNSKLAMANQAALWRLDDEDNRARWRTLHNKINRQSKQRNDIVHFTLNYNYQKKGDKITVYLSPHSYTFTEEIPKQQIRLYASSIRQRTESFRALKNELLKYAIQIGAEPATPSEQLQEFAQQLTERLRDRKDKA